MRSSIACIAAVSFVVAGCSSAPPEENVSTENESALTSCTCTSDTICDPTICESGMEFALNSLVANADGSYTLGGYNAKGAFQANFVSTTAFRQANLNNYPTDPCRTYASQYNTITASGSLTDSSVFTGPISSMAGGLCTAQVWLSTDGASIRAFRPKAP